MLAQQVAWWNLQELKRHNQATESIETKNAATNLFNARVNEVNAQTNRYNADVNAKNAETNRLNYNVNLVNAQSNLENALTNRENLSNQRKQAEAAWENALTNRLVSGYNYELGLSNAESNRIQAEASRQQAATQWYLAPYTAGKTLADTELSSQRTQYQQLENQYYVPAQVVKAAPVLQSVGKAVSGSKFVNTLIKNLSKTKVAK